MNPVKISGYIFPQYNKAFLEEGITAADNNIKRIHITLLSYKSREKLLKMVKHYGKRNTFSISTARQFNNDALNLECILPHTKYPFLSIIFKPELLYEQMDQWLNRKYTLILQPRKMIRTDSDKNHIFFMLKSIEPV